MPRQDFKKFLNLKAPLLITGETGSGKSYLAREIFEQSQIHRSKFLTVHLASLKEDLIESELFGHKKGAFTGALENKNGYLAEVGEGTLFLDEIGELSMEAQKKLLYLMEEKKFTPIGACLPCEFRGRIIMATNKNLEKMVVEGLFREDLYYRIKVFHLKLLPLKDNPEFLSGAIDELFNKLKLNYHCPYSHLSSSAKKYLLDQEWKGNLRELRNSLEYAVVMSNRNIIEVSDFPRIEGVKVPSAEGNLDLLANFPEDYGQSLELFEKIYLQNMLMKNGGKVNETARRIGVSKTTLIQKAKKHHINTLRMRAEASVLAA